jgi:hypothetical protein
MDGIFEPPERKFFIFIRFIPSILLQKIHSDSEPTLQYP